MLEKNVDEHATLFRHVLPLAGVVGILSSVLISAPHEKHPCVPFAYLSGGNSDICMG